METGGRGGGGETIFGIDRLVIFGVAQEFFDIGRSGHSADLGEGGAKRGLLLVEFDRALDVVDRSDNPSKTVWKQDNITDFETGAGDTFVPTRTKRLGEQDLDFPSRGFVTHDARWENLGVIGDDKIAFGEQGWEVVDMVVRDLAASAIN